MRLKVETDAVAETQHLEPCAFDEDGVTLEIKSDKLMCK